MTDCNYPTFNQVVPLLVVLIVTSVIEYWLGKTNKTKAGSILELIVLIFLSVLAIYFKRKENENGNTRN